MDVEHGHLKPVDHTEQQADDRRKDKPRIRVDVQRHPGRHHRPQARRVYTNMPKAYPVSGLKQIVPNDWTRCVLDGQQTFVTNSLDRIRDVFPDHELIGPLGCGLDVNMPVFLSGSFKGTVTILHGPDHYTPSRVQKVHDL